MKRNIAILLCLVLLMSLCAGCASDDDPSAYVPTGDALTLTDEDVPVTAPVEAGQEQQFSLAFYPTRSMNPLNCNDYTNRVVLSLIYQGLFTVTREYEVIPVLCESYTVSEDMLTYTFALDPKATFSDGAPVTVEDAVASLKRAKSAGYYSGRLRYIQSIKETESGKLQIQLKESYENLPLLLDVPIVKAAEVKADNPLGSGPYALGGVEGARVLNRRSNWWCKSNDLLVTANSIPLEEASSIAGIRDNFEFADVGIVCTDPGSDRYVEYRCDYELWECETGIFVYLGVNKDSSLFKKAEVRQALSHGIDRAALVDTYYRGFATAAELPASPNSPYYTPALAQRYAYDEEAFKSVFSNYAGRTITLLVNKDDSLRVNVAQKIAQMLNTSGLIVEVVSKSTATYKSRLQAGEYDLYLGQTKLSPNMDLTPFFSSDGALNYGEMDNVATFNLCLQALENQGNYYTLHQTVMDDGYLCPVLFRSYAVYAARGLLTNLKPARDNLFCYSIGRTMTDAYRMEVE